MVDEGQFGGMIPTIWAVADEDPSGGVISTLCAEDGGMDLGSGVEDQGVELGESGEELGQETEGEESGGELEQVEEKIDGRKGSKEFRDALKAWEQTPEGAKFAKTARGDHFRMQELAAIEPGGITALRDKYALLESIGGPEGFTQLQERVAGAEATDAALASGDPKVFESLGKEFDAGLAKLAPAYLDRVMKSDPAAYAAAILPHLMSGLAGSPMVGDLNKMVDVLQAPHLDDTAKLKNITTLLTRIGQWYEHNERKAGEVKAAPADKEKTEFEQQRSDFEKQQQQAHWDQKIAPPVAQYEKSKLEELYKPYDTRLKLDAAAKADLFATFKEKMKAAGQADESFQKQMKIYRGQKNPDAAAVSNFVKTAINRHAKSVVENAVKARYGRFLGGAVKKAAAVVAGARQATGGAAATPIVVAVKPSAEDIDYRATSEADQWKGIYTLKNGKKVQVRKAS